MITSDRLQQILETKDHEDAIRAMHASGGRTQSECWSIIDGVLVIHDETDPPHWLAPVLKACDEDGNTSGPES